MIDIGLIEYSATTLGGLPPDSRQKIDSVIGGLHDFLDGKDSDDPDGIDDLIYEINDVIEELGSTLALQAIGNDRDQVGQFLNLLANARDVVAAS